MTKQTVDWRPMKGAPEDRAILYVSRDGTIGHCYWSPAVFEDEVDCWWDQSVDDEVVPLFWSDALVLPDEIKGGRR